MIVTARGVGVVTDIDIFYASSSFTTENEATKQHGLAVYCWLVLMNRIRSQFPVDLFVFDKLLGLCQYLKTPETGNNWRDTEKN